MKVWQGLGYYSRARNLHFTAKIIRDDFNSRFPTEYKLIRELKGIGDYTAAAISSFCYNLPYAVLDGNVSRVLSRYFAIDTPIDSSSGKKIFKELSQKLILVEGINILKCSGETHKTILSELFLKLLLINLSKYSLS